MKKLKAKDWSKEPLTKEEVAEINRRAVAKFKGTYGYTPGLRPIGFQGFGNQAEYNHWMKLLYTELDLFCKSREADRLLLAGSVPNRNYAQDFADRANNIEKDPLVQEAISSFPETEVHDPENSGDVVAASDLPW
ncbi:hypothetical protein Mbo2_092 [Rhodococcus phage Mbo2]|uniref:Uncharacterized protein n=1 Tax=Rhodococcus phage Mbo2 TaxID=2936911 RepID=A0A9E7ILS0_9CAUD|nr:hypothetical protein Mbo2_092 [Rhodococcus phage Mbo2]